MPQPAADLKVMRRLGVWVRGQWKMLSGKSIGTLAATTDPCVEVAAEDMRMRAVVRGKDPKKPGHLAVAGGSQSPPHSAPRRPVIQVYRTEVDRVVADAHAGGDRHAALTLERKLDGAGSFERDVGQDRTPPIFWRVAVGATVPHGRHVQQRQARLSREIHDVDAPLVPRSVSDSGSPTRIGGGLGQAGPRGKDFLQQEHRQPTCRKVVPKGPNRSATYAGVPHHHGKRPMHGSGGSSRHGVADPYVADPRRTHGLAPGPVRCKVSGWSRRQPVHPRCGPAFQVKAGSPGVAQESAALLLDWSPHGTASRSFGDLHRIPDRTSYTVPS